MVGEIAISLFFLNRDEYQGVHQNDGDSPVELIYAEGKKITPQCHAWAGLSCSVARGLEAAFFSLLGEDS